MDDQTSMPPERAGRPARPGRTRRWTLLRRALVVALVGVLVATGAVAAQVERWAVPAGDDGVLTLLLLGSDNGPPRTGRLDRANADGFQLLFVSGDRQHATFVSIPRDSYVQVPGRGRSRINACLSRGPEACVTTVESVFGIEVDAYLLTSMRSFALAINRVGGVEIDVPQRLTVGYTTVQPGRQLLDGSEALVFARDRKSRSNGDFGRSAAQAELLAAAHEQLVATADPTAILETLIYLRRHTVTDLSGPELIRLGFEALRLPPANVQRRLLPGRAGMAGAASVVFLDDAAYGIVRDAADDARLD